MKTYAVSKELKSSLLAGPWEMADNADTMSPDPRSHIDAKGDAPLRTPEKPCQRGLG